MTSKSVSDLQENGETSQKGHLVSFQTHLKSPTVGRDELTSQRSKVTAAASRTLNMIPHQIWDKHTFGVEDGFLNSSLLCSDPQVEAECSNLLVGPSGTWSWNGAICPE